jgi:hypothetical protein
MPGVHQLLSIGAVAYDVRGGEYGDFSVNIEPSLKYSRTDPDTDAWWASQPAARKALEHNQVPLREAMDQFRSFVKYHSMLGNAVFLADPVVFDYPWINWAFVESKIENPFHFSSKGGLKVIDLTSFACGGMGLMNAQRRILNDMTEGLPPHTHIAVEDAHHQGQLFFRVAKTIGWPKG